MVIKTKCVGNCQIGISIVHLLVTLQYTSLVTDDILCHQTLPGISEGSASPSHEEWVGLWSRKNTLDMWTQFSCGYVYYSSGHKFHLPVIISSSDFNVLGLTRSGINPPPADTEKPFRHLLRTFASVFLS